MRVGINLMAWSDRIGSEELELLPWLRQLGYDGVEFPLLDLDAIDITAIRAALSEAGLRCTTSTALPVGASLIDADGRDVAREFLRRAIEIAGAIGAEVLCGPLYAPVGQRAHPPTPAERVRCTEALRELASVARRHNVVLAVEPINRFETSFLNIVDDGVTLIREVDDPAVGILADTFHMNIEEKDPIQTLRRAGESLAHIHYSENDRGTIGAGHIPWRAIHSTLRDIGYDRWIVFETFAGHLPQLAAATAIWRPLVDSPEQYAADSLDAYRALESSREC